jgi:hypothetical protein
MKTYAFLALLFFIGCASSRELYLPDGRAGYALNCSGAARSWGMCLQKAGEICSTRGYDVYMRDASTGGFAAVQASSSNLSGFAGTTVNRELVVACKG